MILRLSVCRLCFWPREFCKTESFASLSLKLWFITSWVEFRNRHFSPALQVIWRGDLGICFEKYWTKSKIPCSCELLCYYFLLVFSLIITTSLYFCISLIICLHLTCSVWLSFDHLRKRLFRNRSEHQKPNNSKTSVTLGDTAFWMVEFSFQYSGCLFSSFHF